MSLPPAAEASRPGLVRVIGRWDLTAAIINGVIGSAVFGMPSVQAGLVGAWSPLVALIAGVGVLTIVLCFAEVASRFQEAGGPYLYARDAFGPFIGFEAGWLTFWIRVTAVAANLNVFVDYLARLLPAAGDRYPRAAVMALVVGVIAAINVRGVRQATWTVDAFTIAKLLPLALLVVLGLPQIDGAVLRSQEVAAPQWTQAILLLMFAYGGFEAPLIPAGEARNPRRDTAFALLTALAVIAFLYCTVQLVVIGLVPALADPAAPVKAPVAAAFGALLRGPGVVLASVAAMVSIYGSTPGTVLQSPRVLLSMAERGDLPAVFARVHERFRTPHVSIVTFAVIVFALALFGSFTWNATLSAIVRLLTYGLTCVALLVFRSRAGVGAPGFVVPGAVAVVPVAVGFCLWLLVTRTDREAWVVAALVAAGALIFAARRPRLT